MDIYRHDSDWRLQGFSRIAVAGDADKIEREGYRQAPAQVDRKINTAPQDRN